MLVVVVVRFMLVLFAVVPSGMAQDRAGEIRGSVITYGQRAVAEANVEAREQTGRTSAHRATTTPDGFYVLKHLSPGVYNLRITASGFSTEVRDVQLAGNPVTIPKVPVEIGMDVIHLGEIVDFAACPADPADRHPDFYRLTTATESGAVGGVILSDEGGPVENTTVTLYRKGSGRIGSQRTNASGAFQFVGLHIQSEEYWLSIEREGFFTEEQQHLLAMPGLESVYSPIWMESCSLGHCQAHLKTIPVIGPCPLRLNQPNTP